MITFLVRHADAGDKRSWDGPDEERPLSLAGFRQAEGLVLPMEDYPVDRILCSPTVRCQQTVQPLAHDRLLPIEPVAALGVDAGLTEILELFGDRRLRNAVLCTHGESIGRLFVQLAAQGLVASAPLHWPKGSTWLLHRTDRREIHDAVLKNLVMFGSVNANRRHYYRAAKVLANAERSWLEQLLTRWVSPDDVGQALARTPDDIMVVMEFKEP